MPSADAPQLVASGTGRVLGAPPSTSPILAAQHGGGSAPAVEAIDGQGGVWEYDLGTRPSAPLPTDDLPQGNPSNWATDLDQPDGWIDEGGKAAPPDPLRRKVFMVAAAVLAAVVAGLSIPAILSDEPEEPEGETVVLGSHLAAPVALNLPEGAVATADESYVGVKFSSGGWVLATVPEEVVLPSGERAPMPLDPAGWLRSHPDVFVSGVRTVEIDGRTATQMDYRRSSMAEPQSRYARLPLFCGWKSQDLNNTSVYRSSSRPSGRECTQITNDARVRATFIPVEGRILLVEAVWKPYGVWGWRMPKTLKTSYDELLGGLSPRVAEPGETTSLTSFGQSRR
ncbi:hypothetical protein [Kineosporia babensis]|uniref:Uncharacterized protein n=1 Tax=Kineosporia babensis TaxID=499548 RepID=A0A9X1NDC4_9ACTN|nr:hypothetical protein [Kineosporia babensis]MCD5311689.1 hypothetical protein [Kineosporia babensis]